MNLCSDWPVHLILQACHMHANGYLCCKAMCLCMQLYDYLYLNYNLYNSVSKLFLNSCRQEYLTVMNTTMEHISGNNFVPWVARWPHGLCICLQIEQPGFKPWPRGQCVVFLGKNAGDNPAMDQHPIQGKQKYSQLLFATETAIAPALVVYVVHTYLQYLHVHCTYLHNYANNLKTFYK